MKKKHAAIILLIALGLTACGQKEAAAAEPQVQNTETVQIANPWRDITEEQAKEIYPISFAVPEGAENAAWSVMDSAADPSGVPGALVQLSFDLYGMHFTAREQVTGIKNADQSGMYYDWTVQAALLLKNWGGRDLEGWYCRYIGENEYADLCIWYDDETGVSYSLSTTAKDLDGFNLDAVAEAMNPVKTAEADAAYDTAACAAAAQAVREEFIQVIRAGIDNFDEDAHPELPWYTAVLTRFPENRYFEAYYDFDGNGIPEMVIGIGSGTGEPTPDAVYAFDGQKMHYLCKEHPLGERSYLSRTDGLFIVHGSGGAAVGVLVPYRIAEDGWNTEIVDVIDYEYSDENHVTYTSEYGRISPEEVVSRGLADSYGLDVELDWNCFYP